MNTKKPPLEKKIVRETLDVLRLRGGFWFKIHGSPLQMAGLPDILGCYKGRFYAFEAKRSEDEQPSKLQAYQLKKIKDAGGITAVIWSPAQALDLLLD